ncbi:hypothetical protein SH584_09485 [Sphingomonas sp. LY29]|uniref:hypothetical protein n=1 Tax=Sphingomonas sp. LY29 TaxID=3095341 RepID=UPI002D77A2F6|nr:hypothetical protein [Sphingomonas sp. LY29]WRP25275.1 hypothetical protein SH584_09485 [Sphingomonas sp. LY29]
MSLNFELRREHHAIGEFTASLNFFQPISAPTFAVVTSALKEVAQGLNLPASVPVPSFQFTVEMQGSPGVVPPQIQSNGVGFQRFSPEGEIAEFLSCSPSAITYVLRDYTVWEEVGAKVVEIFSRLAASYVKEVPAIESVRVQYQNEFRSLIGSPLSAAELFRADNGWVAPIACQSMEAWHSHVGVYIPHSEIERRLVNVNCDISPLQFPGEGVPRTLAKVLVFCGCFFNVPGKQPLILSGEELVSTLRTKFDEAHDLEKLVLGEVISDPYLRAIGALHAE